MAEHVYEGMFLFDSNRYARNPQGVSGGISEMIEKSDGELLASRLWSDQKLAYPIKGQRKGTYWLAYFRLDSSKLGELDRDCRLNDNILRNLVLKIDPRLVDTLVEHAKRGTTATKSVDTSDQKDFDADKSVVDAEPVAVGEMDQDSGVDNG